jgi:hypothetical protein
MRQQPIMGFGVANDFYVARRSGCHFPRNAPRQIVRTNCSSVRTNEYAIRAPFGCGIKQFFRRLSIADFEKYDGPLHRGGNVMPSLLASRGSVFFR